MNKKILKWNSFVLIGIGICVLFIAVIIGILAVRLTFSMSPNSWDGLGVIVYIFLDAMLIGINVPSFLCGVNALKYLKNENNTIHRRLSIVFGVISLLIQCISIYVVFTTVSFDYNSQEAYVNQKNIALLVYFVIFVLPILVNIIQLIKIKYNLNFSKLKYLYVFLIIVITITLGIIIKVNVQRKSIIESNIIKVTENNKYSYSEFDAELRNRKLKYKLPREKYELSTNNDIFALDYDSEIEYAFSSGSYTDSYRLSVNTDRKFPMFIYDSYVSLIKKSDETEAYYYIGPEDWWISWNIYFINGHIYAAIEDESIYGSMRTNHLSKTEYGIIVSEENELTIYNKKNNYFVKGGGIIDTESGYQRRPFPTTTDIYNDKCMKIRVVDKINAETLDKIAKELSPRYWEKTE